MADTDTPSENQVSDDDWAAAMSEQATAEGGAAAGTAEDDWAAAMNEQAAHEKTAAAAAATAKVFEPLGAGAAANANQGLELILDIPVHLTVELGRTKISIRNLLQLAHGSVVELDGLAGEPMDVLVNGTLIAQGEVVVVNDKFGIRLTDIITPQERMRKLNN
jgi:flagellar motor switch protein FliN/FliY